MAFKRIERTTLQLGMIMLSSLYVANVHAVNPDSLIAPASPQGRGGFGMEGGGVVCLDTLV